MIYKKNKTRINAKIIQLNSHQQKRLKKLQKQQEREHSKFLRQIVFKDKKKKGCLICKEEFPFALTYHHLEPEEKKFDISAEIRKGKISKKTLYKELSKCVVLCTVCHCKIEHKILELPKSLEIENLKHKEDDTLRWLNNESDNNNFDWLEDEINDDFFYIEEIKIAI